MRMVGGRQERPYGADAMSDSEKSETIGGTPRATKRPAHVKAPSGWTDTPVPAPAPIREDKAEDQPGGRNPVRYGDWERKGIAVDF